MDDLDITYNGVSLLSSGRVVYNAFAIVWFNFSDNALEVDHVGFETIEFFMAIILHRLFLFEFIAYLFKCDLMSP